jgi:transposase InsO family protein
MSSKGGSPGANIRLRIFLPRKRRRIGVASAGAESVLIKSGVRISMDGRGRWMDNVFIERLWRSLKHEDVYLKGYADGREAKIGIGEWIAFTKRSATGLPWSSGAKAWRRGPVDMWTTPHSSNRKRRRQNLRRLDKDNQ